MTQQERIDYIRLRLGNISPVILPDSTILAFLTVRESQYTDEPTILYYTIIDCVNYLIAYYTNQGNSSRIYEQEGGVTVDIQGVDYVSSWKDWLEAFIRDPQLDGFTSSQHSVIVGGVRKTEYDRVASNTDSKNGGYCVGNFFDTDY